ncbi:MAG: chromosomal replication initiator protein DnaA [Victivallales bacterium]|nr:chromosomal replication initiator protein DnaA [Victivallales bacterium]
MLEGNQITVREIWQGATRYLKNKIPAPTYNHWFRPIVPVAMEKDTIVLGVSDDFFADWLKDNYGDLLQDAIQDAAGTTRDIRFEYGYQPKEEEAAATEPAQTTKTPAAKTAVHRMSPGEEKNVKQCTANLLPRYTLDKFVVGEENRYAYAAATTAAKSPGAYNPLYIYGVTGIGKTHLIQGVAHEILKRNPATRVQYITCEEFLNRYVDALSERKHSQFRNWARRVDVLLVDDVHQLANKTQLQEEFFNTFNALYNDNKQIILTSDKQPCEIVGLEQRLVSRFECGVTVEITPPSFETRLAILKQKQNEHLIKLDDDVLQFIAQRITASIRRLEGALMRLVAFSSAMANCPITVSRAEDLLRNLLEEETASRKVTIENIQKVVADYFEIRVTDILSDKRPRNIAEPRMVAMYLSRKMTDRSYPEIGDAFGKNHATIMHAEKKVIARSKADESFRMALSAIQRQLQN